MEIKETVRKTTKKFWRKWSIALKILPFGIAIFVLKCVAHYFELEVMELNALFTTLVAGTIFLLGFLISGVLSDYKESEKIPGEMTTSLKTLYDDAYTIMKFKNSESAKKFIEYQKTLTTSIIAWFNRKERTKNLLERITGMNDFFIYFEKEGVQANYIIKMKNEQNNLRKLVLRTDTIRDTNFVHSAYTIVEVMGMVIAIGLIIIKIEPFYASVFFTLLVTFLILYMFFLIRDIDNPFDYAENGESGTEVSLKLIHEHENWLSETIGKQNV